MNRASLWLVGTLLLSTSVGCGANFDPSNEIKTLRVLGVKKDKPYAQPGDTVNLQMLWTDPKCHAKVETAFIGGCVNPPGDLYYGCFDVFGGGAAPGGVPSVPFSFGDTFSLTLPKDIISGRQGPIRPGQARYGLSIVFFALCGGTLSLDLKADPGAGLPIRCLDANDNPLGSDDFVVGYSSIYSFEGVSNENPSFTVDDDGTVA